MVTDGRGETQESTAVCTTAVYIQPHGQVSGPLGSHFAATPPRDPALPGHSRSAETREPGLAAVRASRRLT